MRYIRLKDKKGDIHLGAFKENGKIFYLDEIFPELNGKTLIDFIELMDGDPVKAAQSICVANAEYHSDDGISLLAPVEHGVHDIICVGVNYSDHLAETKEHLAGALSDDFSGTVYFGKRASRILGPDETIKGRHDIDDRVDYEAELAVIMGKSCKAVSRADAEKYIFGYSVFNDLSSRMLQTKHSQWLMGKSLDDYSIMGPVIVDRTELPLPLELNIKSYVNGELRQNSNTRYLIKNVSGLIEELSRGITLDPGDIIATGTPAGVGMGFVPPKFLKKGDRETCEIEKIGQLTNVIA